MVYEHSRKKGMRLIILDILGGEDLHGYAIAERIETIYGVEKPSSGVVYPVLSELKRKGLLEISDSGKRDRKTYHITPEGKAFLEEHADEVEEARTFLKNLGEFQRMEGKRLMMDMEILVRRMHLLSDSQKKDVADTLGVASRNLEEILESAGNDE